jgi:hypothetical protein
MAETKKGSTLVNSPFKDAIVKPGGGHSSPAPAQNNKTGK